MFIYASLVAIHEIDMFDIATVNSYDQLDYEN